MLSEPDHQTNLLVEGGRARTMLFMEYTPGGYGVYG
jgi:hypothetical protein